MSSLKTMFVFAVLAAIAGGVYISLQRNPVGPMQQSDPFAEQWPESPSVQLGGQPPAADLGQTVSPPWSDPSQPMGATSGGMAPPFDASQLAPAASSPNASFQLPVGPAPGSQATTAGPAASVPPGIGAAAAAASPPPLPPTASTDPMEFAAFMDGVRQKLQEGRFVEVLQVLSEYYEKPNLPETQWNQVVDLLDRVAYAVIYSRDHMLEPAYTVRPGDTLPNIAQNYNVPWQLLAKINGITDPESLEPGQQLKVVRGRFEAEIDMARYELTLKLRGLYAGRFRIGVSPQARSLSGSFLVQDKSSGTLGQDACWIKLADQVIIHAASDPGEIGTDQAGGSICVEPDQIENLHAILSLGSLVRIVQKQPTGFSVGSQPQTILGSQPQTMR